MSFSRKFTRSLKAHSSKLTANFMKLKDDFNLGLGIGIFLPTLVFFCLFGMNEAFHLPFKLSTIALVALFLNTVPVRNFGKIRKLTRGIVVATFILSVVWVVWFLPQILKEI